MASLGRWEVIVLIHWHGAAPGQGAFLYIHPIAFINTHTHKISRVTGDTLQPDPQRPSAQAQAAVAVSRSSPAGR